MQGLIELGKILGPAIIAVLSARLAYAYARRQARVERRLCFIAQQLTELYAPLRGNLVTIRTLSTLRSEISAAANKAWATIVDQAPRSNPEFSQALSKVFPPFDKQLEYDNKQLRDELLPQYREMVTTLSQKIWLAEPSTSKHLQDLIRFVEIWNRHLEDSLPADVLKQLVHSENALQPFYDDLMATHDRLANRLRTADVD